MADLHTIQQQLIRFRDERNWKQFHTLRNLIVSLNLEAGELLELTQWKTDAEMTALKNDARFQQDLQDECADVFLYLLQLANEGGFDLLAAAEAKIARNALRYPVAQSYGNARKRRTMPDEAAGRSGEHNDLS